ncbi:hypothetical protein HN924_02305 [Candidatus Woesearchaeota archaeon]|jgi:hypothetical protein|nr:hypothetical protein [Candidatus Woesearchaeota archaeon]MBT7062776.1 hypothetical protein [Candidatus Woesearchaeota archaeon]MBT7402420.1 hypothetical protein [Candidatus Woesearchaeota archaeon]
MNELLKIIEQEGRKLLPEDFEGKYIILRYQVDYLTREEIDGCLSIHKYENEELEEVHNALDYTEFDYTFIAPVTDEYVKEKILGKGINEIYTFNIYDKHRLSEFEDAKFFLGKKLSYVGEVYFNEATKENDRTYVDWAFDYRDANELEEIGINVVTIRLSDLDPSCFAKPKKEVQLFQEYSKK